jgi:SHS2 domain-containing protein
MPHSKWEHFPHEADMGVRGTGATLAQAFEQAALALTAVITDPAKVVAREQVAIQCEAPDPELLFVDWLNAIVYEMATRHMLFSRFEVAIVHTTLTATLWGEPLDTARHQPAVEVKGATYTALRVAQENGRWIAQTVVDV